MCVMNKWGSSSLCQQLSWFMIYYPSTFCSDKSCVQLQDFSIPAVPSAINNGKHNMKYAKKVTEKTF